MDMNIDMERARREGIRWYVMVAINAGRPTPVAEGLILSAIQAIPIQCTTMELRRELYYLADRDLVKLHQREGAPWSADLTHHGVDVVEYTVDVMPGIARPKKYF